MESEFTRKEIVELLSKMEDDTVEYLLDSYDGFEGLQNYMDGILADFYDVLPEFIAALISKVDEEDRDIIKRLQDYGFKNK